MLAKAIKTRILFLIVVPLIMSCCITFVDIQSPNKTERALYINKDFIVSIRPEDHAERWLAKLGHEYAAMHDATIVSEKVAVSNDFDWDCLDSATEVLNILQGDTQRFLREQGFNELDYIDALETILMRSYLDTRSMA